MGAPPLSGLHAKGGRLISYEIAFKEGRPSVGAPPLSGLHAKGGRLISYEIAFKEGRLRRDAPTTKKWVSVNSFA